MRKTIGAVAILLVVMAPAARAQGRNGLAQALDPTVEKGKARTEETRSSAGSSGPRPRTDANGNPVIRVKDRTLVLGALGEDPPAASGSSGGKDTGVLAQFKKIQEWWPGTPTEKFLRAVREATIPAVFRESDYAAVYSLATGQKFYSFDGRPPKDGSLVVDVKVTNEEILDPKYRRYVEGGYDWSNDDASRRPDDVLGLIDE